MATAKRARFDDIPLWRQLAQEYETAVLEQACFRGVVVPAARTEANIVDDAWKAADARYQTEEDVKAYAQQMLYKAQSFYDSVHGGAKIVLCVQDASDPQTRVYCCINMCDKLQVAIDTYRKMKPHPSIKEIHYDGVRFADNRVYPYNTPHALAMDEHDTIRVLHEDVKQDPVVHCKTARSFDICILGAEGLVEETFVDYTYLAHETLDKYAQDFCTRKRLDARKVCFMHGGETIKDGQTTIYSLHMRFYAMSYIPKPGPLMIYVHPKPEFESDPDQCFVPGVCPDEQEQDTHVPRRKRPVVKMNL